MKLLIRSAQALAIAALASNASAQTAAPIAADAETVGVTCADFNTSIDVAIPGDDATPERLVQAKDAQDDIALGLTWVHGYFFAYRRADMPKLSQNWLREIAASIAAKCGEAKSPEKTLIIDMVDTL